MPRNGLKIPGSDLLRTLNAAVEGAQGKKACKLCVAIDSLDEPVARGVRSAIAARRPDGKHALGPRTLTKILQQDGIEVGHYTVERHLRENHDE